MASNFQFPFPVRTRVLPLSRVQMSLPRSAIRPADATERILSTVRRLQQQLKRCPRRHQSAFADLVDAAARVAPVPIVVPVVAVDGVPVERLEAKLPPGSVGIPEALCTDTDDESTVFPSRELCDDATECMYDDGMVDDDRTEPYVEARHAPVVRRSNYATVRKFMHERFSAALTPLKKRRHQ